MVTKIPSVSQICFKYSIVYSNLNKFDIFIQPLVSHFIRNKHGRTAQRVLNELKNRYLKEDGLTKISCTHHMSHGYAAFYTSPYDEAIALTFDGLKSFKRLRALLSDCSLLRPCN